MNTIESEKLKFEPTWFIRQSVAALFSFLVGLFLLAGLLWVFGDLLNFGSLPPRARIVEALLIGGGMAAMRVVGLQLLVRFIIGLFDPELEWPGRSLVLLITEFLLVAFLLLQLRMDHSAVYLFIALVSAVAQHLVYSLTEDAMRRQDKLEEAQSSSPITEAA